MSEGNEEHVNRNYRKGETCYAVAESLEKLCPVAMWKELSLGESTKVLIIKFDVRCRFFQIFFSSEGISSLLLVL